jgi:hypothetical protein
MKQLAVMELIWSQSMIEQRQKTEAMKAALFL